MFYIRVTHLQVIWFHLATSTSQSTYSTLAWSTVSGGKKSVLFTNSSTTENPLHIKRVKNSGRNPPSTFSLETAAPCLIRPPHQPTRHLYIRGGELHIRLKLGDQKINHTMVCVLNNIYLDRKMKHIDNCTGFRSILNWIWSIFSSNREFRKDWNWDRVR